MIVSVGIDMIELARVRAVLERHPERFLDRHFHPQELADLEGRLDPVPGLAARFAAKEAAMKALGTGHSHGVFWTGIEVVRRHGPPRRQVDPDPFGTPEVPVGGRHISHAGRRPAPQQPGQSRHLIPGAGPAEARTYRHAAPRPPHPPAPPGHAGARHGGGAGPRRIREGQPP